MRASAKGNFHAYRVDAHDGVAYSRRRMTTRDTPLPDFQANLLEFQRLFPEEAACLRYPGDDRARRRRTRCLTRGRALGVNLISMEISADYLLSRQRWNPLPKHLLV